MSYPTVVTLPYGNEKLTSVATTKHYPYGTRAVLPDGRAFRYAKAGATELAAGRVCQAAVQPAAGEWDMDVPISSAAYGVSIGDPDISVDLTTALSTVMPVDEFMDGILHVNDGPGEGHVYRIASHLALTSDFATAFLVRLADNDKIRSTALTTNSLIGLVKNQYKDVVGIDLDVTFTNVVGVTPVQVPTTYNFWLQTFGYASVLVADNAVVPTLGGLVQPQLTTSDIVGAISGLSTFVSSEDVIEPSPEVQIIGQSIAVASVDTDYGLVFLTIAP